MTAVAVSPAEFGRGRAGADGCPLCGALVRELRRQLSGARGNANYWQSMHARPRASRGVAAGSGVACGERPAQAGADRAARAAGGGSRAAPQETGKTGSLWRLHYSVRLPSLACDFFRMTPTKGVGTGESLRQFPVEAGDCLLADRGYSTAKGLLHVRCAGSRATVRVKTSSLPLRTSESEPFDLLAEVRQALRGSAGQEADSPRERHFPLVVSAAAQRQA